jgi:translation initiation factor IF-3
LRHPRLEKKNIPPINDNIRFNEVQVILEDGENLGVVSRSEALRHAQDAGLDLVLITESGSMGVPVTKIMDYGKSLYSKKKKQAEAKKHQKVIQVKEVKIRPKIDIHDLQTKIKQAADFLKKGKHVKVTAAFRGREMVTKDQRGTELFAKVDSMLKELGIENIQHEPDSKMGQLWSRIYFLKTGK